MRGKRASLPGWLALGVLFVSLAVSGTMDCTDHQKAEEFRQETKVVMDSQGEWQLVDAREEDRRMLEMYGEDKGDGIQKTAKRIGCQNAVRLVRR